MHGRVGLLLLALVPVVNLDAELLRGKDFLGGGRLFSWFLLVSFRRTSFESVFLGGILCFFSPDVRLGTRGGAALLRVGDRSCFALMTASNI